MIKANNSKLFCAGGPGSLSTTQNDHIKVIRSERKNKKKGKKAIKVQGYVESEQPTDIVELSNENKNEGKDIDSNNYDSPDRYGTT